MIIIKLFKLASLDIEDLQASITCSIGWLEDFVASNLDSIERR